MTKQYPDGGQTAGQGRDSREPPARPLAALVHSDGSTEELQPPGAAALLAAGPELVDYARAHAESATARVPPPGGLVELPVSAAACRAVTIQADFLSAFIG